jgi:hypothetical protein
LQPGGVQERLKPWAFLSMSIYTIGMPLSFAGVLFRHRDAIRADQQLRAQGGGESHVTNPNLHIRKRYQELYSL